MIPLLADTPLIILKVFFPKLQKQFCRAVEKYLLEFQKWTISLDLRSWFQDIIRSSQISCRSSQLSLRDFGVRSINIAVPGFSHCIVFGYQDTRILEYQDFRSIEIAGVLLPQYVQLSQMGGPGFRSINIADTLVLPLHSSGLLIQHWYVYICTASLCKYKLFCILCFITCLVCDGYVCCFQSPF